MNVISYKVHSYSSMQVGGKNCYTGNIVKSQDFLSNSNTI